MTPDRPYPTEPTLAEQIASVRREIAMRERAYPRWIRDGRLDQTKADHEIACMHAVLKTLGRIIE